ncbi:MAG: hypothetical protein WCJ59_01435 [bacterium]
MIKKNINDTFVTGETQDTRLEAKVLEGKAKKGIFRKIGAKKISLIILVLIAVGGVWGTTHFYNKYKSLTVDATAESMKETQRLVSELGKIMELPKGETPTVATISDKEKLKGQAFFTMAENGDVLFAYTASMKAILFRPSTSKIINVAPISINQAQDLTQASTKTSTTTLPAKKK